MFVFPHGLTVDRHNNVWITEAKEDDGKGQPLRSLRMVTSSWQRDMGLPMATRES